MPTPLHGATGATKPDLRYDFRSEQEATYEPYQTPQVEAEMQHEWNGHSGGDFSIMDHFTEAVAHRDPGRILSGPQDTLESYLTVFAAEQARRENRLVALAELLAQPPGDIHAA